MLIGHDSARAQFATAQASGRLHHAWLLAGPEGVGKRSFAEHVAQNMLGGGDPAALMAAGTHPDYRVLRPPEEGKGAAQKIIPVEQVREIRAMLHEHPALGDWRVILVDSVDAMNMASANAMLKELEEPAKQTLFLLVSHSPARLLPTIRSRCRMLRFQRLSDEDSYAVLAQAGVPEAEIGPLVALANGAPGVALAMREHDVTGLGATMNQVMRGADPMKLARLFQAPASVPRFQIFLKLLPAKIADMARSQPDVRLVDLHDRAQGLASGAIRLAYDRVQVAFALASLLAEAGTLHDASKAR